MRSLASCHKFGFKRRSCIWAPKVLIEVNSFGILNVPLLTARSICTCQLNIRSKLVLIGALLIDVASFFETKINPFNCGRNFCIQRHFILDYTPFLINIKKWNRHPFVLEHHILSHKFYTPINLKSQRLIQPKSNRRAVKTKTSPTDSSWCTVFVLKIPRQNMQIKI